MHLDDGQISRDYRRYVSFKIGFMALAVAGLILALAVSLSLGAAGVPLSAVAKTLLGIGVSKRFDMIVWNIRMPQALAAIVAGAGHSARCWITRRQTRCKNRNAPTTARVSQGREASSGPIDIS